MLRVTELNSYPIKSCAGTSHFNVEIGPGGLLHDREWMVANAETGAFLSQRTDPALALIKPYVDSSDMLVTAPGMEDLLVDLDDTDFPAVDASVWSKDAPAIRQSQESDEWFSQVLGKSVQFLRKDPNKHRLVVPARQIGFALNNIGFADGAPILLTTESSLEHLNAGLDNPVPMNRFRPNIVVGGGELDAFDEDFWREIKITGLDLFVAWACSRCVITETDQATAQRGKTVLKALRNSHRGVDATDPTNKGVFFGQNLIPAASGHIAIGDSVHILECSDERNVILA